MKRTKRVAMFGLATLALLGGSHLLATNAVGAAGDEPVMPAYDERRRLLLPEGYETWVFAGSSLGLSYSEGSAGMEMFHHTLIEPTAYQHFRETGTFREGTMLALLLHGTGEGVLPSRRGRFASEIHGVELAVKDSSRVEETWAYYNFGGMGGLREAVDPMPAASCQSCHLEHAGYDNVFVQFYPLLVDAAPAGALPASFPGALPARADAAGHAMATLALAGLDPVHLVEGREELGKQEIVMEVDGLRYQFVSEPSRKTFAADPSRYVIQNETCPVAPGTPINPSLISVYEKRIYALATPGCVTTFEADPANFVEAD